MIPSITLGEDETSQQVKFYDEREDYPGRFASLTIEDSDGSWGHFLSRRDIIALRSWCSWLLGESK